MKATSSLLWIYTAIGLISAVTTGYFLYQKRIEGWNEYAQASFAKVLKTDLQKREVGDVPYFSWGIKTFTASEDSLPDNSFKDITMTSEHGKITYRVPTSRLKHNIENNYAIRFIQSYILVKHPLVADSLNLYWTKSLQERGFSGNSFVRVSVIDLLKRETKHYSGDSLLMSRADSLFSYYIGRRSEIEVTGFLLLPWWKTFFWQDIALLGGLVLICFLLPFCSKYINRFYHTYLVRTKVVTVEQKIPVLVAEPQKGCIYQLDAGVEFNYDLRVLCRGDQTESLTPRLADLLKLFLGADNYLLTTTEIGNALWPNTAEPGNNIYVAIKNLRFKLSGISRCTVDNKNSSYQLKIPHSIEENGSLLPLSGGQC